MQLFQIKISVKRQASASLLTLGQQYPVHWLRCHFVSEYVSYRQSTGERCATEYLLYNCQLSTL